MASKFDKTFASVRLDKADAKALEAWRAEHKLTGLDVVSQLMGDGYKVSATYIADKSSFCVSIIGTEFTKPNASSIMTAWSDDLEEAMIIGAYKHYVLCDGGSWPTQNNDQPWG